MTPQEALRAVTRELAVGVLSQRAYRANRTAEMPTLADVIERFGSWPRACTAAGVEADPSGAKSRASAERVLEDLSRSAAVLGLRIRRDAYAAWASANRAASLGEVYRVFGSWERATEAAGVLPYRVRRVCDSDKLRSQVAATLARLREVGVAPSVRNFDRHRVPGTPTARRIGRLHGGWSKALADYGDA